MLFSKRDRVRLRAEVAATVMKGFQPMRRRHPVDWHARIGSVVSIGRGGQVLILWDGLKSHDIWPVSAIELA